MYDELFENPAVVARYRAAPYAKSREQFLKKAQANGYSPRTLMRMAWALLVVAEIVRDAGGRITPEGLRSALYRQVKSKWAGHPPSGHTIKLSSGRRALAPELGWVNCRAQTATKVCDGTARFQQVLPRRTRPFPRNDYVMRRSYAVVLQIIAVSGALA